MARGAVELVAPEPEPVGPAADALGADDYVGDVAARTGFSGLEAVEEVTIVAVPDLVAALEHGAITEEIFKAVQLGI
ncbi:MAG: phage tail sheath family protein, partial [Dermatophilaceae bacterium]